MVIRAVINPFEPGPKGFYAVGVALRIRQGTRTGACCGMIVSLTEAEVAAVFVGVHDHTGFHVIVNEARERMCVLRIAPPSYPRVGERRPHRERRRTVRASS